MLSDDEKAIIKEEEGILHEVMESLDLQRRETLARLRSESARARTLTSEIVQARVNEEKEMLASDEAVSHRLRDMQQEQVETIEKLLTQPYFARVIVQEQSPQGKPLTIEYKLGKRANSDCRIVDWRKAPISRLYYEYQEGEEYCEDIQGREREGRILERRKVDIQDGQLQGITTGKLRLRLDDKGEWIKVSGSYRAGRSSYGSLPDVLSLITAEQFRAITEEADSSIFVQGVAGSGKTTVALYRLSWMLKEYASELSAERSLVLVQRLPLREYISNARESLDLPGIKVKIYRDWVWEKLKPFTAPYAVERSDEQVPPTVSMVKNSFAFLALLEEAVENQQFEVDNPLDFYWQMVEKICSMPRELLERDQSSLLDREIITNALTHTRKQREEKLLDRSDEAAFLRLLQLLKRVENKYDCVVVDEVQDFDGMSLATVVSSVKDRRRLTFVGDPGQQFDDNWSFPGWDRLRKMWSNDDELAPLVSLQVSHRSTRQIMRLADYVAGERRTQGGRNGKPPLWFKCITENKGVSDSIGWLQRVVEKFPDAITTVICADPAEARHVLSLLEPTFGAAVRLGDQYSFSFEEGIIVTDVRQVKGLEFLNVLIWNPTARQYRNRPRDRSKLYTAMTRAEEFLAFATWGRPSRLLPSVYSKLVRGLEREAELEMDNQRRRRPRDNR